VYNLERVYEVLKAAMAFLVSQKEQIAELPYSVQRERQTRAYERMVTALDGSRKGLNNLKDTYYDDTTFQVRLQLMTQEVDDFLGAIQSPIAGSGSSSQRDMRIG